MALRILVLLLLLALPLWGEEPITLTLHPFPLRAGAWGALGVEIALPGQNRIDVELEVIAPGGEVFSRERILLGVGRRRLWARILAAEGAASGGWGVRLRAETGDLLAEATGATTPPFGPENLLVGLISRGERLGIASLLQDVTAAQRACSEPLLRDTLRPILPLELDPEHLPSDPLAYAPFDLLLLDLAGGVPSAEVREALSSWVLGGGRLLLVGTRGETPRWGAAFAALLPAAPRGWVEPSAAASAALLAAGDGASLVEGWRLLELEPSPHGLIPPILSRRQFGAGSVSLLAVDPADPTLRAWPGRAPLLGRAMGILLPLGDAERVARFGKSAGISEGFSVRGPTGLEVTEFLPQLFAPTSPTQTRGWWLGLLVYAIATLYLAPRAYRRSRLLGAGIAGVAIAALLFGVGQYRDILSAPRAEGRRLLLRDEAERRWQSRWFGSVAGEGEIVLSASGHFSGLDAATVGRLENGRTAALVSPVAGGRLSGGASGEGAWITGRVGISPGGYTGRLRLDMGVRIERGWLLSRAGVITLPEGGGEIAFTDRKIAPLAPFLQRLAAAGRRWQTWNLPLQPESLGDWVAENEAWPVYLSLPRLLVPSLRPYLQRERALSRTWGEAGAKPLGLSLEQMLTRLVTVDERYAPDLSGAILNGAVLVIALVAVDEDGWAAEPAIPLRTVTLLRAVLPSDAAPAGEALDDCYGTSFDPLW